MDQGSPIHGDVISADASSGVAFKIYRAGSTVEETIAGTTRVCITDILFNSVGAETATIGANKDAAHTTGNLVAKIITETGNLNYTHHFAEPFQCPPGKTPELICTAGQVDCVITGYLLPA